MKIRKPTVLSFICVLIILWTMLLPNQQKVYATANETSRSNGYTTINSQTLLEANDLDTLVLNYTTLPKITVTGTEKYNLTDATSLIDASVVVRQVEFPEVTTGKTIDSVITVKFNNCGNLNGRPIDMKLVYSDFVAKGERPFLYWSAYGNSMKTNNEWWYRNIEHMTVNIYFYYTGSNTTINLDTAYLSLFSEDRNEGASSKISSNQYLYEKTYMNYVSSMASQCTSRTYENVFYGTTSSAVDGNTEAGTLKCVSFQYQKINHLDVELYALNNKADIGYHLQYTSLTATIPNETRKTVSKTEVNTQEDIIYTVTQNISKATDQKFYYHSLIFQDVLNNNLTYQWLKVYDENNKEVTSEAGSANYNANNNTLTYHFNNNYLKNMNYKGQAYKFEIKAKVNKQVTTGNITNTSTIIINDKYTLTSNTVESKIGYKVMVNHVDEEGNKLAETQTIKGYEGDQYTTSQKQIYGYELIQIPENSTGSMTQDTTFVTYHYKIKDSKVIAQYVDEKGKQIETNETIDGKVFEPYQTKEKNIYGYELMEMPSNYIGTITEDTIVVTYRYELKNSGVRIRYIDEDENILADDETIQGKVFDEYTTRSKRNLWL